MIDAGGELMPSTLCFVLANVRGFDGGTGRPPARPHINWNPVPGEPTVLDRMRADPRFKSIPDGHLRRGWIGPGCMGFNAGHVYRVDNTDPASVSRGIAEGRRLAQTYRDGLAAYMPEFFANSFLVSTGSLLGARETRRIIADYELTVGDYAARRSFADEVCRNAYFIDSDLASTENAGGAGWEEGVHKRFTKYAPGESHGIPWLMLGLSGRVMPPPPGTCARSGYACVRVPRAPRRRSGRPRAPCTPGRPTTSWTVTSTSTGSRARSPSRRPTSGISR